MAVGASSTGGDRLPAERLWMGALLRAIGKVPDGERLNIRALRDPLGISQADALATIELLIAEGRLDRQTLRPPARCPAAVPQRVTGVELVRELEDYAQEHGLAMTRVSKHLFNGTTNITRLRRKGATAQARTIAKVRAFTSAPPPSGLERRPSGGARVADVGGVTGAELADKLDALIAQHGLSRNAVGKHLVGQCSGVATIRHSNPRRKTVDRILAFLADPPLDQLKPRNAWTTRRENERKRRERAAAEQQNPRGASGTARKAPSAEESTSATRDIVSAPQCEREPLPSKTPAAAPDPSFPSSFEEQLARVARGDVGIGPNLKFGRPDPSGTLGGVTGEINL